MHLTKVNIVRRPQQCRHNIGRKLVKRLVHSSRRRKRSAKFRRHNKQKEDRTRQSLAIISKELQTSFDQEHVQELIGSLKHHELDSHLELCKIMIKNYQFDMHQLRSLRTAIDDRINLDIISGVPYEIALYIMSFLSPRDLCQAAQTCRSWRTVCEDNRLWREKCREEGLLDDEQTSEILFRKRISNTHVKQEKFVKQSIQTLNKPEWKKAYLKHMDILRNWRCRDFEILDAFIAPVEGVLDSSISTNGKSSPVLNLNNSISSAKGGLVKKIIRFCSKNPDNNSGNSSDADSENQSDSGKKIFEYVKISHNDNLMQLRCHEDSVITCLQYNPRTNTIVSGSDDQTLKVWSSETGRCLTVLEGHTGGVWSSQLSPDDIVISGSTDRTLKVWEAHSGRLLHTLYGHTSTVRCLSLDGDQVVSGSRDTTLRLWDIKKGTCIHVFQGHTMAVRCVEYKNNIIVSGAYDYLVMVWDAVIGVCLHSLECHSSRIYSLQFDGKTIASGSLDATICIWDAATGKLRHHLAGHTSLTSKMQLKGNLLVSANADSYCKIWDINTGLCLFTLGGENKHTSAITSVYFNNRHVVTSSDDGTVKLWDLATGQFLRNLVVLPTASRGGVVWRIRASYTKLICAVGSRTQIEDTHLLVLNFND